jgi:hypothetical protein
LRLKGQTVEPDAFIRNGHAPEIGLALLGWRPSDAPSGDNPLHD